MHPLTLRSFAIRASGGSGDRSRSGASFVDEMRRNAEHWCDRADFLAGQADRPEVAILTELLEHITAGIDLRLPLDGSPPGVESEAIRRTIAHGLADLRQAVDRCLARMGRSTRCDQALAPRAKEWLNQCRISLRNIETEPGLDELSRVLKLEGLRGDLEWLSTLIARLDREPPHGQWSFLEVEVERVRRILGPEGQPRSGPDRGSDRLRSRCRRIQGVLLERRVRSELRHPTNEVGPERLMGLRLHLSRLQARVASLESEAGGEATEDWIGGDPEEWVEALAVRRVELADLAESRLLTMSLEEARRPSERIAHAAHDEISETIAFLEDMPLRRAVKRLELAREDRDELTTTLRRTAAAEREQSESAEPDPERTGELDSEEDQREEHEVQRARERIGRQVRHLQLLKRRVNCERQERLLALRLESLLERRLVRWMETLVLWLIIILVGLIVVEAVMDRRGWLTPTRQEYLAWVDLAICSILLL